MARRIAVRGIIYKNDKVFAQRHKKYGAEVSYWSTPGGGLDAGESLREGLRREMMEETGVDPDIGQLLYIQQYGDSDNEYLEFFYLISNADDYDVEINLAATTHGAAEIARCGFIDPTQEMLLPEFLQTADIATDIRSGGVKEFDYLASA